MTVPPPGGQPPLSYLVYKPCMYEIYSILLLPLLCVYSGDPDFKLYLLDLHTSTPSHITRWHQKLQASPSHASNSCATPSQTSCCCCRFVVCIVCRPGASALNIFCLCFLFQSDIRHQLNKKPNEFSNFCGHKSSCSKGFLTHFKTLN